MAAIAGEQKEPYRKTIRFSQKSFEAIEEIRKAQGLKNFSEAIAYVIESYTASVGKEGQELKQQEKAMTRIRLASNGADVSTQVILEILNSMCWDLHIQDFRATGQMEHPVIEEAKQEVKERIARYKQKKDWKKDDA